jgi:outer membrane protein assembly factor BamB
MWTLAARKTWLLHSILVCILLCAKALATAEGTIILSRPLVVKWIYETRQLTSQTPAAFDDLLYVPLAGGLIVAVRSLDGQLVWRSEAGGEFSTAPTADERAVYVGSELSTEVQGSVAVYSRGAIRALSRTTGLTLWTRTVPNPLEGGLVMSGSLLLGASADGRIYALNKGNGTPAWIVKTPHAFTSAPTLSEDKLFLAANDGNLIIVEFESGNIIGSYQTEDRRAAPFSVSGRTIYVGSQSGYVTALRSTGGRLQTLWRRRSATSVQSLTSTPSGVLVTSLDNFVQFLSPQNGNRLWKRQLSGRVAGGPLVSSDTALFSILGGEECIALSLMDGKQVNTLPLGEGNAANTPSQIAGPVVIVPTRFGLIAFAHSETKP